MKRSSSRPFQNLIVCLLIVLSTKAHAQLALTDAGTARGFRLNTFASGFVNGGVNSIGPLSAAFLPTGEVLVTNYWEGKTMLFPSGADGQDATTVPVTQVYGPGDAVGLVQTPSDFSAPQTYYMTQQTSGHVIQVNPDGTFNQPIVDLEHATGIAANPANGHLFVSQAGGGSNSIFEVDPIAKSINLFTANGADGLSINPDGSTLYAVSSTITGYDTATGQVVFTTSPIENMDGLAFGLYSLAGKLYASTTDGNIVEVDMVTGEVTVIATGGSRGDFIAVDPNGPAGVNPYWGSLLLSQTDSMLRLVPPHGGAFYGPPGGNTWLPGGFPVPEPNAVYLLAGMVGCCAGWRLRRRR